MSVKCVRIGPDNEIDKLLMDTFTNTLRPGYVEVGEEKTCMPLRYETIADRIDNFEVRNTDVIIATHPKTGTTWTQEMVWMMLNDMDMEKGKKFVMERSPFLEQVRRKLFHNTCNETRLQCIFDYREVLTKDPSIIIPSSIIESINFTANCTSNPRIIKTHLPWSLLPRQIRERTKTPKIIYVIRNPKDTCVSYYHHSSLLEGFLGDFNAFHKLFLAGRLNDGPFWQHLLGYWEIRNDPNMHIIRFEDMKKDLASVIRKVDAFLGAKFDEERIPALVEHLSFENMKKNPSVQISSLNKTNSPFIENKPGEFMRSGTVGSYKVDMTPEIIEAFDTWTEAHTRGTGLTFDL